MKTLRTLSITATFLLFIPHLAFAQPFNYFDLYRKAELDIHRGWIPHDIETLIKSPDIIIKGRFGRLLSHEIWFGYSDTRETLQKKIGVDAERVDEYGLPSSVYEIIVDEVLFGNVDEGAVTYRLLESSPGDRRYTSESDEKLFFLTLNPDGTYGRLGIPFILTSRDGRYSYEYPSDSIPGGSDSGAFDFAPSMVVEEFDDYVRDQIRVLRPSN